MSEELSKFEMMVMMTFAEMQKARGLPGIPRSWEIDRANQFVDPQVRTAYLGYREGYQVAKLMLDRIDPEREITPQMRKKFRSSVKGGTFVNDQRLDDIMRTSIAVFLSESTWNQQSSPVSK